MNEIMCPDHTADSESSTSMELKLFTTMLRFLSTTLTVMASSQRVMNQRLDASHEAYLERREHHKQVMKLLDAAIAPATAPVSGKARRRRARSQSAAG